MDEAIYLPLKSAKRFAWPVPELWHTPSLSEDDLRGYYRFRRLFMDLKAHIDPQDDWNGFAKWMRKAEFSWLGRNSDGRLHGVISFNIEYRVHEGQGVALLWCEYGYSLPEARKSKGLATAVLAALALSAARHPFTPVYLVGTAYLPSFIALGQLFDANWIYDGPAMSPWEQSLWRSLAQATPGFDPEKKVICMGTIPRNPRVTPPTNPKRLSSWNLYRAHNPNWTQGYTCFCMGRLQPSLTKNAVLWFKERLFDALKHAGVSDS